MESKTDKIELNMKSKLMSDEEFLNKNYSEPYTYKLKSSNGFELVYFGGNHTTDVQDPQYPILSNLWEEFIQGKNPEECLVLLSGGTGYPTNLNLDDAIHQGGECNYIAVVAHNNKIRLIAPEPDMHRVNSELEKQFARDQIEYYYFARVVAQWNRFQGIDKPNFRWYMEGFLEQDRDESGWVDYDFSIENMRRVHKQIFGTEMDENDKEFFDAISNPYSNKSIVNEVGHEENIIRDENIVREILRYIKNHNLFIVFGSAHAIVQEKALRDLVK